MAQPGKSTGLGCQEGKISSVTRWVLDMVWSQMKFEEADLCRAEVFKKDYFELETWSSCCLFCFPTVGREAQRKSGHKPNGENQPDRRDGHFQHVCPALIFSHNVSNIPFCQPDGAGVKSTLRSWCDRMGTGISLLRNGFLWLSTSTGFSFSLWSKPKEQEHWKRERK